VAGTFGAGLETDGCGQALFAGTMTARASKWEKRFPYRGRRVLVARLPDGWRVELDGQEARARTVVDAFETLLKRPAGDQELDVVLAALARDRGRGREE
jgi:hypothetical protein